MRERNIIIGTQYLFWLSLDEFNDACSSDTNICNK